MKTNLETMMRESDDVMGKLKDDIIEEWRVAEEIKEAGVSREVFIKAMKQEIPRLRQPDLIVNEETFLRVYYDKTPFWCRGGQ